MEQILNNTKINPSDWIIEQIIKNTMCLVEIIIIILIGVAFITLAERKVLGSMQRRERSKYSRNLWIITTYCRWFKIIY